MFKKITQSLIEPNAEKINDLKTLLEMYVQANHEAQLKLSEKITDILNSQEEKQKTQTLELIKLLDEQKQSDLLFIMARLCNETSLLNTLLALLSEQQKLELLFLNKNEACKQQLLEQYTSIDELKHIEKQSLNKDKKTTQLIKEKIEQLHNKQKHNEQLIAQAEQLVVAFEHLANSSYAPLYESKLQHLHEAWQQLNTLTDAGEENYHQKFQQWLSESQAVQNIERYNAIAKTKVEQHQQQEQHAALKIQNQNFLDKSIQHLEAFLENSPLEVEALKALIASVENKLQAPAEFSFDYERFQSLKAVFDIELNLHNTDRLAAFDVQINQIEELFNSNHKRQKADSATLDNIRTQLNSVQNEREQFPRLKNFKSALHKQLDEQIQKLKHFEKLCLDMQEEFKAKFDKKTGYIKSEVENKALATVGRLIKEAEELLPFCPDEQKAVLQKRLENYKEDKKKLDDWYTFATLPKRQELCEAMEALGREAPRTKIKLLKEKIKQLQDDWKQLGFAKDDEGKKLWKRFQDAGDQAYLPVKQLIDKKEAEKQHNLEIRQSTLEQLTQVFEASFGSAERTSEHKKEIDWNSCEKALRRLKHQWEQAFLLPTSAQKLNDDFNELVEKFERKLKPQRAINLGAKNKLIEQAKKITELEDNRSAIEQIKNLQQEWKHIGFCEEDDALWKSFKSHCDSVFNQRDHLQDQLKGKEKADIEQALAICTALETINKESAQAFEQEYNRLCAEFNELKNIPRKRTDIQKQFDKARKHAQTQLKNFRQKTESQRFLKLLELSKSLAETEKALLANNNFETFQNQIERKIQENNPGDALSKQIIQAQQKIAQASNAQVFIQERNDAIRRLCVELEIELDVASPAQDQGIRMEIQVQRLNKKFNTAKQEHSVQQRIEQCFIEGGLFSILDGELAARLVNLQEKL